MKNIIYKIALSAFALSTLFFQSSCNKDNTRSLNLDITYKVNALSFAYDEVYTINGVAIKFSLAQMYISGFHIEDDEMNEEHFESKYLSKSCTPCYQAWKLRQNV